MLLSPLFIFGLLLLLANDFLLKPFFHNSVTGKLSDIAGLFILPIFLTAFFSKARIWIYAVVFVLFCFWKSTYSEVIIDAWNQILPIHITRIPDLTDLFALAILPASYLYTSRQLTQSTSGNYPFAKASVIIVSVFAFTATHYVNDRNVWVERDYAIQRNRAEFEECLRQLNTIQGVSVEKMTDIWPKDKYPKLDMSPTGYYLRFKIRHSYCESKEIEFFSSFEDRGTSVLIDGPVSFSYWCPKEPSPEDESALAAILDDTVLGPLGQTNQR